MSNYGRWSGNGSAYETGYGAGSGNDYSSSYSSTGNQSGYGGGGGSGSYGGDSSMYGSMSSSYDGGSNYDNPSSYGTGSSSYTTGDSSYGGSSYVSGGGSSYNSGATSGYGGSSSTRTSGNSGSNYDSFLSTQQNQVSDMSKKLRKMEMMQEIAKLEQEDDMEEMMLKNKLESLRQQKRMKQINMPMMNSYNNNGGFGGMMSSPMAPMGRNAGGYGNRGNFGNQRHNPMGRNANRGDRGRPGNRGGGAMRGNRNGAGGNRNDRRNSSGPGRTDNYGSPKKTGRFADRNAGNKTVQDRKRKPEATKGTTNDRNAKRPRQDSRAPVSEKERDEKLKKFMTALKTFADKNDAVSTFYSALRSINVRADIKYFQKTGALFFDRLYLGRGRKNTFKQMAFKEALEKLKILPLDKIKTEAAEVSAKSAVLVERDGINKHNMHDNDDSYRSPIEFADLPFVERLGLFIEAMKIYGLLNIRIFCAKYMINCIQIYEHHENENLPHEHHIYLNEVYITSARGAFKKESDMETMNKMMEILEDKSLEEIMKNDNRFSKDYPEYPLYVKDVGIGNDIIETNHLDLKFGQNIHDFEALKSNDVGDVILIEEAAWRSSMFKVLQESATCCQMVLKCTWTTEHPGGAIDDDESNESETSKEEKEYKETLKKIRKLAIEKKVMMIHCKIELQDKLIGRSVDTAKGLALKNAAAKAYNKLQETQAVIRHDYGGKKLDSKQYQWEELVVKATELRKELPDAPNFDHVKASEYEDLDNSLEEEHGNDDVEVKKENGDEEVKEEENEDKIEKEKSEAKKKEEEELAPWIKEVVRREIEELSNTDILVESILMFYKPPLYVRDVINHYTLEYSVSLKTDWKGKKISRLTIRKKLPNLFTLLDQLKAIKEKKSDTFVLEQSKNADGSIEKHNERVVRKWMKPRNTRNRRFRRR
ncbi:hypothetical protein LOTGIDRAFT_237389 [Lottia gigantea]|uniref:Uncharacterized protein n=1 Tax=Lottia gigantea TaxID=225164 RepID=V4AJL6_LOTGI|nr:hypothetical protein LOTGIDRAFT_237389 [Lottia gigantea]ESP04354.1 hypothetical protein LOTGIDRAFT_237389 [Lottia gigantea]